MYHSVGYRYVKNVFLVDIEMYIYFYFLKGTVYESLSLRDYLL